MAGWKFPKTATCPVCGTANKVPRALYARVWCDGCETTTGETIEVGTTAAVEVRWDGA